MTSTSTKTADDVGAELRRLIAKSIEANGRLVKNGSDFLRHLSDRSVDQKRTLERSREIVASAVQDYLRLSAAHTSRLIDLAIAVSDQLAAGVANVPAAPAPAAYPAPPRLDLELHGVPGALCQTAFRVTNDRSEPATARFGASLFVDAAGDEALDLPIRFDPAEIHLVPGDDHQVIAAVDLPADTPPGRYHTIVGIHGMPDSSFRLVLRVEPPPAEPRAATDGGAAPKRKTRTKPKATADGKGKAKAKGRPAPRSRGGKGGKKKPGGA